MSEQYLSPAEAAKRLGEPRHKVYYWLGRGYLKGERANGGLGDLPRWRIPVSEVQRLRRKLRALAS